MPHRPIYILVAVCLLTLLVGCGRGARVAPTDAQGRANLQLWTYGGEEFWRACAERFMREHADTNVLCDIPVGAQSHGKPLLVARIAAGNPPDVVVVDDVDLPAYADSGVLLPLDDLLAADGEFSLSDFAPSMVRDGQLHGRQYSVPWYGSVVQITYRKDLFAQAGVEPPRRWEDIVPVARRLQEVCGLQYPFAMGWLAPFFYANFLWQNGAEITREDGRTLGMADEEAIAAIRFCHDLMYKDQIVDPALAKGTNYEDLWSQGQAAFMVDGSWNIGQYDKKFPDLVGKWWVAPLFEGRKADQFYGGQHLAICAKSPHPQLAFEFVKFATSVQSEMEWSRLTGSPPGNLRVFDSPQFAAEFPALAFIPGAVSHGRNFPIEPWFPKVYYEMFQGTLEKCMADPQADIGSILRRANAQSQAIVDADMLGVR